MTGWAWIVSGFDRTDAYAETTDQANLPPEQLVGESGGRLSAARTAVENRRRGVDAGQDSRRSAGTKTAEHWVAGDGVDHPAHASSEPDSGASGDRLSAAGTAVGNKRRDHLAEDRSSEVNADTTDDNVAWGAATHNGNPGHLLNEQNGFIETVTGGPPDLVRDGHSPTGDRSRRSELPGEDSPPAVGWADSDSGMAPPEGRESEFDLDYLNGVTASSNSRREVGEAVGTFSDALGGKIAGDEAQYGATEDPGLAGSVTTGVLDKSDVEGQDRREIDDDENVANEKAFVGARDTADAALSITPARLRPGVGEALVTPSGRVYTHPSVPGADAPAVHPRVQAMLDRVTNPGNGHGRCGLVFCLSNALEAGDDPTNGTAAAVLVRRPTNANVGLGIGPCTSCQALEDGFNLKFVTGGHG